MKRLLVILFLTLSTSTFSQSSKEIVGFWLVKSVEVGDQVMTPDAKWARFNSDGTQESGNGWFQHSIGTWEFDETTSQLSVVTENGLDDRFGAFNVSFKEGKMIWERTEEGMEVLVNLERIEQLPLTLRDKLLGLWKLTYLAGNEPLYQNDIKDGDYLHIRWDGKFVVGKNGSKSYGVYNVHAHKPELELIPYGDSARSYWKIILGQDGFELRLLNADNEVIRKFNRIKQFPY